MERSRKQIENWKKQNMIVCCFHDSLALFDGGVRLSNGGGVVVMQKRKEGWRKMVTVSLKEEGNSTTAEKEKKVEFECKIPLIPL